MTDAREIIAQEFRQAHRDTCYPDASTGECEIAASVIVASLTAAGFRIIGPNEVDPVTLEKAAALADLAQAQREQLYSENGASINAHKAVQAEEIASAIRAIGRKA